jgi:hypothetical protein
MGGLHTRDTLEQRDIDQHLKAALTDLLNTEPIRSEERYRTYIQKILIDVEQRIRKQRHRSTYKDWETAASIATSLGIEVYTTDLCTSRASL